MHRAYDGAWSVWGSLGGEIVGAPAAVSWGPDRIDAVVRGLDNSLCHKAWDGTKWTEWANLGGGPIRSTPSITSRGVGQLEVFAATDRGTVIQRTFAGGQWSDWAELNCGGTIKDTPAAIYSQNGHIDIVAQGVGGPLWQTTLA